MPTGHMWLVDAIVDNRRNFLASGITGSIPGSQFAHSGDHVEGVPLYRLFSPSLSHSAQPPVLSPGISKTLSRSAFSRQGGRWGRQARTGSCEDEAHPDSRPPLVPRSGHPPVPSVRLSQMNWWRICHQPSKHRLLTEGVFTLRNVT